MVLEALKELLSVTVRLRSGSRWVRHALRPCCVQLHNVVPDSQKVIRALGVECPGASETELRRTCSWIDWRGELSAETGDASNVFPALVFLALVRPIKI